MKYVMFATLSMFSLFASAATSVANADSTTPVVEYNYSQNLDIAKVISLTSASSNECEPVKAHMIYLDSQGVRHNLEYLRLSDICATS
ncbi:DUF2790 domain-containing protein [Pseudomonas sp. CDFA 602]|uniref:DUF2790 domain-containing protein n=1 Tax=Pseudomonas californiensis TaxID=2829823 RepID=UPI001E383BAC|nr:DUF2790 domain-containing protein [Pseudomonas californiensis]MCD5994118.1 DUF2790 domain-containing protein [Pseudomonas californiensis]MCD5999783.1 DUF2790 domain-containing protein [Pseudomonas californiensis]